MNIKTSIKHAHLTPDTKTIKQFKTAVLSKIIVLALIPGLSGAVGYNSSAESSPNATTNTIFDAQQSGGFIPGKVEAAPTSFYAAGFLVAYNVYITLTGAQALFTAIAISGKLLTTLNNPHAITEINGKFGEFVEDIDLQKLKKLGYNIPQNVTNKILEDRPSWWNRPLSTAIANANKQNNATVDIYAYVFYISTLPETQLVSKVDFIPEVKTKVGAVCAGLIKEDSSYIDICKNIITSPVFDLYLQFINELRIQNSIATEPQICVDVDEDELRKAATEALIEGHNLLDKKASLTKVDPRLITSLQNILELLAEQLNKFAKKEEEKKINAAYLQPGLAGRTMLLSTSNGANDANTVTDVDAIGVSVNADDSNRVQREIQNALELLNLNYPPDDHIVLPLPEKVEGKKAQYINIIFLGSITIMLTAIIANPYAAIYDDYIIVRGETPNETKAKQMQMLNAQNELWKELRERIISCFNGKYEEVEETALN